MGDAGDCRLRSGVQQSGNVDQVGLKRELALFEAGHVEPEIDQRQKLLTGTMNRGGVFADLGGGTMRVAGEAVGKADDEVERGAQFVRHAREKVARGGCGPELGLSHVGAVWLWRSAIAAVSTSTASA